MAATSASPCHGSGLTAARACHRDECGCSKTALLCSVVMSAADDVGNLVSSVIGSSPTVSSCPYTLCARVGGCPLRLLPRHVLLCQPRRHRLECPSVLWVHNDHVCTLRQLCRAQTTHCCCHPSHAHTCTGDVCHRGGVSVRLQVVSFPPPPV
jgi:hypothetical protein